MRPYVKVYFQLKRGHRMGRKKYSKELKAQIALDAIKGQKTIAELASEYGVHANRSVFGRSSYLMPLLLLLATEKIKMLRKKRLSGIICIKRLANCKSKLIG